MWIPNNLRLQNLAVTARWSENTSDKCQKIVSFGTFVSAIKIKFLWHCSCWTVCSEQLSTKPLSHYQHLFCKLEFD